MSGIVLTVEHGATAGLGALCLWVGSLVRDWFKRQKPIEERTHSIVDDFATLAANLNAEIERQGIKIDAQATVIEGQAEKIYEFREANHDLRNKVGKLMGYVDLVMRWATRMEDQIRGAGLEPEARPELPTLG